MFPAARYRRQRLTFGRYGRVAEDIKNTIDEPHAAAAAAASPDAASREGEGSIS